MTKGLNLEQVLGMSDLEPTYTIIEPESVLTPALIPSSYIPRINYFSGWKQALFYGLYAEKQKSGVKDLVFYSPSVDLITSMMLTDEEGVRKMLGQGDALSLSGEELVNDLVNVLRNADSYTRSKGLDNILAEKGVNSSYYSGHAGNGSVESKVQGEYVDVFKQLVTVEGDELVIPDSLEAVCTCGLGLYSKTKNEFNNLVIQCHHLNALFRSFKNPELSEDVRMYEEPGGKELLSIDNIFSPFSPLESPGEEGSFLRKVLRKGLEKFLIKHQPLLKQEEFKEEYGSNGYTWRRVELDSFLLSFNEVYDKKVLDWFNRYQQVGESFLKTALFLGDVRFTGVEECRAEHVFNNVKGEYEHRVDGNWFKTGHGLKHKESGSVYAPFSNGYVKVDEESTRFILKHFNDLDDERIVHDESSGFEHVNPEGKVLSDDYEVVHLRRVWKSSFDSFSEPFQVANLPNGVRLYLSPYQFRKV